MHTDIRLLITLYYPDCSVVQSSASRHPLSLKHGGSRGEPELRGERRERVGPGTGEKFFFLFWFMSDCNKSGSVITLHRIMLALGLYLID